MALSKRLQLILGQASTLRERLGDKFLPVSFVPEEDSIDQRIERWKFIVAQGNHDKFVNRLMWDTLTPDTIRSKLGAVSWQGETPPAWIETLEKILATAKLYDGQPVDISQIYLLFVKVARQELNERVGEGLSSLSDDVFKTLECNLLERLNLVCAQTFRSDNLHVSTLDTMILTLFREYSALARLVITIINSWVEQTIRFLQDLEEDLSLLRSHFGEMLELGQVVAMKLRQVSEYQQNFVAIVTFACGLKLVYKSRPLGMQAAYEQLLFWLNQSQAFPLKFKTLKVLDRNQREWVEFVEHQPCLDQAAVKRYYQRSGMLLGLVYGLSGIDCHSANLIANGEYPVLIDTETLLQPQLPAAEHSGELSAAERQAHQSFVVDSVMQTGFLPFWRVRGTNVSDGSGLAGTDQNHQHLPVLVGQCVVLKDYESDLIEGFQQMYHFLIMRRDTLLSENSPWMNLTHHPLRFLFRANRVYESILRHSLQPKFLRSGIDRSIELDVLSRAFLIQADKPKFWAVLHAEMDAIEQLELPHFTVVADQTHLIYNENKIVQSYFKQSGYESTRTRLYQLSQQDLNQQIQWMRASIYARQDSGYSDSVEGICENSEARNCADVKPFTPNLALEWAVRLAKKLQQQAIYASDGSVTWIGLTYLVEVKKFQLQPIDDSLFQGSCGIALFVGALAKLTDDSEWREFAYRTLQPLCHRFQWAIKNPECQWMRQIRSAGATELGGYIYSLTRLSQFLDEPQFLQAARIAASYINPSLSELGVLNGLSGVILGLLALYQATHEPSFLAQACQCGEVLIGTEGVWMEHSGFAYGTAGAAYALIQLFAVSGDPRFFERGELAMRMSISLPHRLDWAKGSTGIGLGYIGSLSILDMPEMRQGIDVALSRIIAEQGVDHLYGGNFGHLELLLSAAEALNQPSLQQLAQSYAAGLIDRAQQRNGFYLCPHRLPSTCHPGFFQGISGIGYELLRLASPQDIPSVLLWK
jgi:lantibiotic modifying enzyme